MKETKSRFAVLGMLSIRPMSGYDIKKAVEGSISNFWTESYGQIYPILKRLVGEKLVVKTVERQSGKPDRHVYELTARGRSELQDWLGKPAVPKVQRNELLLKLFFGEEVSAATNLKHVQEFRRAQLELLANYRLVEKGIRSKHRDDPNSPYWLMTLDYGTELSRALLKWCDKSERRLRKMIGERSAGPRKNPRRGQGGDKPGPRPASLKR
ncbi:MAG TPA: PadR family transcriptional regulator [Chthoniobacterales bacterium]|jgi:DNA-binding PadR family transcriptional regulator|nr:PadR family transcriptional regulator [Chthoniobacterales bacterium]